ncbi:modification methylase, HemK family [Nautilia profundicola AmH]|uniref:peptide chain release factor N(5)-glutamine methyltransferase n=1 Tax=Nautilia profundicola (strain ATCC BAA-1463 / DSM 18972 / AmH) TaxID=598659 RepID=B9L921_NAUPA|nr:peptide chain release factor N(5)-glutamine methyltransferase [Nautilia profundicola]ACM92326.1 modification methylase, HemK family [Nautilia profundicola AmH]
MKIKDFLKETNGSYILEKVLNKDKTWLFLHDDLEVPKEAVEILRKVKSGYPVEYIFEEVWFYGDRFYIKEGVLIPRDDTEVVLERAIKLINEKCKTKSEKCKIVDCCTGSGVIAIEIAKHTNAKVIATDISDTAIEVAEKNIALHNVDVEVKKCDLLKCEGEEIKADILVSNPPYVENSWQKPNVYEPDLAFYGGDDGLDIVKELILKAKDLKYKAAVIEIGYNQKNLLSEFLKDKAESFEFFNDLAGNVRGIEIIF